MDHVVMTKVSKIYICVSWLTTYLQAYEVDLRSLHLPPQPAQLWCVW